MPEEPEAITLEEEEPLDHVGEEADAPGDKGRGPAEEDAEPPDEPYVPEEPPRTRAPWRVAKSLLLLRAEIDHRWPNRDRRTDGTIGDAAHCPGSSDHCPNQANVVRAFDIDSDGIPAAQLAEHFRKRGAAGDARMTGGGYVIFNRRIASEVGNWGWRTYTGRSPHTDHIHLSVSKNASGYDAGGNWAVAGLPAAGPSGPTPASDLPKHALGSRVLQLQSPMLRGTDVAFVQRWVGVDDDDGVFGEKTRERVIRFQRIAGLEPNGVVAQATWRAMRVG